MEEKYFIHLGYNINKGHKLNEDLEIKRWIENIQRNKKPSVKPSKFKTWYTDFIDDTIWNWDYYIVGPWKNFVNGIHNFKKYRKLIWNDRWWDYYFFMKMLRFKLKDMEENWGKNTHYVGDQNDKDILKKVIDDLDWMLDDKNDFKDGHNEEYKKRSKRAFGYIDRHHRKWWD
jgi:hypothetical protein